MIHLQDHILQTAIHNYFIIPKMSKGFSQKSEKSYQSTKTFITSLMQQTGVLKQPQKEHLLEPFYSNRTQTYQTKEKYMGLIPELFSALSQNSAKEFYNTFTYGVQMQIWRKDNLKKSMVFVDPNISNLVWFSSNTKAFLFDMAFTDIDICDFQFEMISGMKHYFILRYFQEQIPMVFKTAQEMQKYQKLFKNFIKYNRQKQYPPFFSRIMKLYTVQETKSNISRKKTAESMLNITQNVVDIDRRECEAVLRNVYKKSRNSQVQATSEVNIHEIIDYFRILHCCENLQKIYQKYAESRLKDKLDYLQPFMNRKQFVNFLIVQQKILKQDAQKISFNHMKDNMNFYQFCIYLQNQKVNHAAEAIQIIQDLPLTDYFCYSSHNTYLSGNQLTSDSKIQRYLQDLQRGLKCVQIDIHNDGQTPIINHALAGKSLCAPIDFQQTIRQISYFCDSNPNHYPIILSIQNHANQENRYKVTNILNKYLFKKIYTIRQEEDPVFYKTLKQLRGKVIIKTDSKWTQFAKFQKKKTVAPQTKMFEMQQYPQPKFPNPSFQQNFNKFQQSIARLTERKETFDLSIPSTFFLPVSQMTKVSGIFKSQKGIQNNESKGCDCTSLTSNHAIKTNEQKIIHYTKRSFLRVYPLASEIASNNYDPAPHLKIGAQIIALNTQTKDQHAWMMMSYFKAGRFYSLQNIGYIQKPLHLRSNTPRTSYKKIIQIKVMSDIKIFIEFKGTERDIKFNPKNKQNYFETLDYDEAFLIFTINQDLKECIPIRFIRQGYRVLVAKNRSFKDSGLRVLVQIRISQELY